MNTTAKTEPPTFPVPDFDGPTVAFGASEKDYLTRDQMGAEFYSMNHPMCNVARRLFYSGGKLADHGLKVKDELDSRKVMNAIRALMGSWAPKHEIKIGTLGVAFSQWLEPIKGGKS